MYIGGLRLGHSDSAQESCQANGPRRRGVDAVGDLYGGPQHGDEGEGTAQEGIQQ